MGVNAFKRYRFFGRFFKNDIRFFFREVIFISVEAANYIFVFIDTHMIPINEDDSTKKKVRNFNSFFETDLQLNGLLK